MDLPYSAVFSNQHLTTDLCDGRSGIFKGIIICFPAHLQPVFSYDCYFARILPDFVSVYSSM